ncbi:probable LRR receptor-like serine/threonine-protein kinase At2g16250 [Amborella trichopoda]|uniref:probable LRR receptor-like serine/threonine-protein kinase At2g16250 n=1 Tax=Amborella trichopoda TaxID=13333 RepID=UPI0005D3185A|nr:probable LRR receptor-like serine/threonine-protein kinase At2g16250 [Amborella trichopoda]|eukprot:XP_011625329.1 probable LRR receptor-like serine/threonine-protein kinase At2g16250 [Amborella trichopoda]
MDAEKANVLIWGVFGLFGFMVFLLLLKSLSKILAKSPKNSAPSPFSLSSSPYIITRELDIEGLKSATDDFSSQNVIKVGESGEFYEGYWNGEEHIVVKKVFEGHLEKELDIRTSLVTGSKYLVPLIGQCIGESMGFLVYRPMANRDLATVLANGRSDQSLPWIVRLKIAVQAAEALVYLHHSCIPPILHNDIKSSSILLDQEYNVRLGSLTKAQRVTHQGSLRHDVRCFGKVLMDLVSGLDYSGGKDPYAQAWAHKALVCMQDQGPLVSMDPSLVVEEDLNKEITGVAYLAKACLSESEEDGLTMKVVRQVLDEPSWCVGGLVWDLGDGLLDSREINK